MTVVVVVEVMLVEVDVVEVMLVAVVVEVVVLVIVEEVQTPHVAGHRAAIDGTWHTLERSVQSAASSTPLHLDTLRALLLMTRA